MPGSGTSAHRTDSRPPPFDFPYFSQPKKSTPRNLASTGFTGAPKNLQKAFVRRIITILGVVGWDGMGFDLKSSFAFCFSAMRFVICCTANGQWLKDENCTGRLWLN